jgi:Mrp family chromosome partitioning ATPase
MSRLHDAIEKARKEGAVAKPRPAEGPIPLPSTGGLNFVEGASVAPRIEGCLAQLLREDEPWLEQVRTLATRLRSMEGSDRVRRIGLASAVGGEGKTTLAVMLSLILAEQPEERVLLVDCDLRHRDIEAALGLKPASGLSDWLRQPTPDVPVRRLSGSGLYFLSAGRPFSRPWELVSSPQLGTLLDAAGFKFRYVVVDLPAEGPVADSSKIQEHLDGILLVVRARTAPRDAILSTLQHLNEEKLLGVLFNAESEAASRLQQYRYSHYAKTYRGNKGRKGKS